MTIADRIAGLDWAALAEEVDATGFAQTPAVLTATECRRLAAAFDDDERLLSTIHMRRSRRGGLRQCHERQARLPLRRGRVPLLRLTAARAHRPGAPRAVRAACRA